MTLLSRVRSKKIPEREYHVIMIITIIILITVLWQRFKRSACWDLRESSERCLVYKQNIDLSDWCLRYMVCCARLMHKSKSTSEDCDNNDNNNNDDDNNNNNDNNNNDNYNSKFISVSQGCSTSGQALIQPLWLNKYHLLILKNASY